MSDTPYEKECMYCKTKIRMSKESGKWLPYNLNNGPHDCRTNKKETKKETTDREDKIARIIKMIEAVVGELEDLKNEQ